ncbi:hypothetical protein PR003_g23276 [Phytophthora rubi]|uniref:Uncharacterized protein n=1 Tax=Phytophthora rubi TaxID=129364 RepID=A0A6A3IPV2_9STRA|nr:hypothetical protein PR001_g23690 [Phytophthora rubi]KAE9298307.1 hypothetical protein PR003_g23276 [Phytophthora rubi]
MARGGKRGPDDNESSTRKRRRTADPPPANNATGACRHDVCFVVRAGGQSDRLRVVSTLGTNTGATRSDDAGSGGIETSVGRNGDEFDVNAAAGGVGVAHVGIAIDGGAGIGVNSVLGNSADVAQIGGGEADHGGVGVGAGVSELKFFVT